ncbi:MAG: hypothetical protein ACI9XC_001956 [Gammaproteobacteria bacterium]|jgi:hypothetical protein
MGEINAMCTKSTMHELIFRGDRSGACALGCLCPWTKASIQQNNI